MNAASPARIQAGARRAPEPLATPMRADEPEPPMDAARAVANAPEASDSAFVVPKVIAGEEEG